MGQIVISANNLTKTFSGKEVIRNCTFSVERGSIYGFLGRNGAGKTTLINIIMALYKPDRGEVIYDNHNVRKLKESYYDYIGYLPQMPQFYKNFSTH